MSTKFETSAAAEIVFKNLEDKTMVYSFFRENHEIFSGIKISRVEPYDGMGGIFRTKKVGKNVLVEFVGGFSLKYKFSSDFEAKSFAETMIKDNPAKKIFSLKG